MRYIKTNNRHVELVEADSNGKILSSKGFQFGQLYYQIKNNKVTFYMVDNENPWRNDVWTCDIPLQVNDEVYSTPEEVGGILYEIMNDSLQEQIDDLGKEDARLDQKIEDESERAKEAEANLQEQIDAIDTESIERKLDQEIARSTSKDTEHDNLISGLTNVVNNEITRSTAKDAEHDGLISGLTTSLNNEIQRAINAENNLLSGLTSEISRATNAENELDIKIDNEITRSTAKDTQHDEKILALENANSTLTQALNSEISRAISAETEIANDLDKEIADREADVDAEEARAIAEEARLEQKLDGEITRSTNKDTEHDEKLANLRTDLTKEIEDRISGDTSLQNQLNSEISRATAAENTLDAKIDQEISDRIADVNAEETRATAAEEALDDKLDAEILRSTNKDTEHDNLISGITEDIDDLEAALNSEIQRALSSETSLHDEILNENSRAISAETGLHNEIVNEASRAVSAETELHNEILSERTRALDAESNLNGKIDQEIADRTNADSALNTKIENEITRSTGKDVEHDEKISKLENDLDDEIARAINAENALDAKITQEISDRIADVNAEETRAIAEEQRIEGKLDSEITRSTAKDASHDVLISGLTDSLNTEIQRATTAENALRSDLNAETQNRISGDTNLQNQINAEVTRSTTEDSRLNQAIGDEVTRATASETSISNALNNEIQRAMSAETELHNEILSERTRALDAESGITLNLTNEIARATAAESALTADIATINTILPTKADKVDAVASAEYISQNHIINFKNINGDVISHIDATDFIKDGMVSDAYVRGENLVITFNTDSGKENIEIPISDIFNANNYYTKAEVDASQAVQDTKISVISGRVETLDVKASNLSANTYTKAEIDASQSAQDAKINSLSGDISSIVVSLDGYATEQWVEDKHYITGVDLSDYASKEYVSGFTYNKETIDEKIAEGGTFDPTQYYTKAEVDASQAVQDTKISVISGRVETLDVKASNLSANTYTKAEIDVSQSAQDAKINSLSGNINSIVSSLDDYATEQWVEDKHYITGVDLSDYASKEYVSGFTYNKETIDQKITDSGTFDPTQYYTKTQSDAKYLTEHQPLKTINGNVISGSGNIEISSNNVIELTQAEYDALTEKDLDAFYIITDAEGVDLSNYYTKAESDGRYMPISTVVPTKVSQLQNDVPYLTSEALDNYVTDAELASKGYLTEHQPLKTINGNVISGTGNVEIASNNVIELTEAEYDALETKDPEAFYILTDAEDIDLSNYYTKAETSGATEISTALASKLDVSAFNTYSGAVNTQLNSKASESNLNALNDTVTAHTSDTSVHTTDAEKASWNGAVTKSNANETALGGLKLVSLTQAQYDALATKDSSTIYFIKE